jgi:hypothetical protein
VLLGHDTACLSMHVSVAVSHTAARTRAKLHPPLQALSASVVVAS